MTQSHVGGSFAPPLPAALLAEYRKLVVSQPVTPITESMSSLITMVEQFATHAPSDSAGTAHPSGKGTIVPLHPDVVKSIWELVPWQDEINLMGARFEQIDPVNQKPLRDAAFHLLWFAGELTRDRMPMTSDLL